MTNLAPAPFATQAAAVAYIAANNLKYDMGRGGAGFVYICGLRSNGVDRYEIRALTDANGQTFSERKANGPVPGATKKLSITDRAVMLLVKGRTKEQVIAELIENGATKESARCTAHFVFTGKVSKRHADIIAAGKWSKA